MCNSNMKKKCEHFHSAEKNCFSRQNWRKKKSKKYANCWFSDFKQAGCLLNQMFCKKQTNPMTLWKEKVLFELMGQPGMDGAKLV